MLEFSVVVNTRNFKPMFVQTLNTKPQILNPKP